MHRDELGLHALLELAAELADDRADRPVVAVGQAADGGARGEPHAHAELEQQVQISRRGAALLDAAQELVDPAAAFSAGRALPAGFVLEESRDVARDHHHVGVLVEDGRAGRAQAKDVAGTADVEVHRGIELVGAEHAHAHAAGDRTLEPLALAHAAAVVVDERAQLDAQRRLKDARTVHVAADAHELGAVAGHAAERTLDADPLPPRHALLDDGHDGGERLDVVDDRRAAEEALDRGERGLHARPAALALDRFEQAGLLAADVGARRTVQEAVHAERARTAHEAALAEDAAGVRLLDRLFHHLGLVVVLAADEEVRGVELARVARDRDAFEDQVRIEVAEQAILEGAGLGFIAVDAEVAVPRAVVLRKERPLEPRREARTAASADDRFLDELDHLGRLHVERLGERRVAAGRLVLLERDGGTCGGAAIADAGNAAGDALGEDGFSESHGWSCGRVGPRRRWAAR